MNPVDELVLAFKIEKSDINDDLMNTRISKQIEVKQIPDEVEIKRILKDFNKRDTVEICLKDESDDSVIVYSNTDNWEDYNKFIENNLELETIITLNIIIKKEVSNRRISVYNIDSFFKNFMNNTILENLEFFNYRFTFDSSIIFVNYDNDYMFNTSSIIMVNNDKEIIMNQLNRLDLLERCNSVSNFANNFEYALLPEDFAIIATNMNNDFIDRLQELKILFSLLYILDYSIIEEKKIKLKLNGYRNNDYVIEFDKFFYIDRYEEFYKIYTWIFQDANEYDKMELTRHVISMFCKYTDILSIDEKTFLSIKSNYNIYLKKNVDKYIELKKKLTEFIISTSSQINEVISNFISNFEKNIFTFLTFILGTVITNIVSERPLDNILTTDIVIIILVILLGSCVYLTVTIVETYCKFLSYKKNYYNLKDSYKDILNQEDINIIFNSDIEYINNKKSVINVSVFFSVLWILMILVILVLVTLNCNSVYIKKVIDIIYVIVSK